jgi:hypothetical protein
MGLQHCDNSEHFPRNNSSSLRNTAASWQLWEACQERYPWGNNNSGALAPFCLAISKVRGTYENVTWGKLLNAKQRILCVASAVKSPVFPILKHVDIHFPGNQFGGLPDVTCGQPATDGQEERICALLKETIRPGFSEAFPEISFMSPTNFVPVVFFPIWFRLTDNTLLRGFPDEEVLHWCAWSSKDVSWVRNNIRLSVSF